MHLNPLVIERLKAGMVTLEDVAAIVRADLPNMTEAQLAQVLGEIHHAEAGAIGAVAEPLVRAELTRRRSRKSFMSPVP